MIQFKTLRYKNFLSTGNTFTEIQLDKAKTTLVLGQNGSGKSTMLDALVYCLYKKPFRKINKDQLVNTVNGADCVCEVEFEIGTHTYKVSRGINKDFFYIYEDGATEPRHAAAGQKDDQAYLEQDILRVNYDSFVQVVILGNAKYVPFMQLAKGERRSFIEFILDIGVFSNMNEVLKTKQTALGKRLDSLTAELETTQGKITLVDGFIAKLQAEKQKVTDETQRHIVEQNNIIEAATPVIEELQGKLNVENEKLANETGLINENAEMWLGHLDETYEAEIETLVEVDYSAYTNKLAGYAPMRSSITKNLKDAQKDLGFYQENDNCNNCKQTIHSDFKENVIEKLQVSISKFEDGLIKLDKTCDQYRQLIEEAKTQNEEIRAKVNEAKTRYQQAVRKAAAETQEKIKAVTADIQASIRKLNTELQGKQTAVSAARQIIKKLQADIKAANSSSNLDDEFKKKKGFEVTVARLEQEKNEAIETRHYYDVATVLLKDTGIKAAIIKQYLSTINKLVNSYLAELDFFLHFHLDENFKETFKARHRDTLQYNSFSEGEKMLIDVALLFAWRDIANMKNSCATNLLMLDEVIDSSLDFNKTDLFIKLLNRLGSNVQASNVFVISHKNDSALDKFQDVLRFEKKSNFSRLVEEV